MLLVQKVYEMDDGVRELPSLPSQRKVEFKISLLQ